MSNLIVTIISAVLMAVVGAAGYFLMGDTMTEANVRITATKYMNDAQMVGGAYNVFASDHNGVAPASLSELTANNYLKALPAQKWSAIDTGGVVMEAENISEAVCKEVNKRIGLTGTIPSCSTPGLPDVACCNNS